MAADLFPSTDLDTWKAQVRAELKGRDPATVLARRANGGLPLAPLYTAADLPSDLPSRGLPGQAPYVRGTARFAVTVRWDPIDEPSLLARAADVAALRDDAGCDVEVRVPLAGWSSSVDVARAMDRVPAPVARWTFELSDPLPSLELLLSWLGDRRLGDVVLSADPLAQLARAGALPTSLDRTWDELATVVQTGLPRGWRPLELTSEPWAAAGASDATELALLLADLHATLVALTERGLPPSIGGHIALRTTVGRDVFLGIARLRALRLLRARLLSAWGISELPTPYISVVGHPGMQTARDPWVNLLRGSHAGFAALAGGADAIEVTPFDSALRRPSEQARRIARNTTVVLAREARLDAVDDPAGGSWFMESLTDRLARDAWAQLQDLERDRGLARALVQGRVQASLEAAWTARQAALARRKLPITGVSEFADPHEERLRGEPTTEGGSLEHPREGAPDPLAVDAAVQWLRDGGTDPDLPAARPAAAPTTAPRLAVHRDAEAWETLRDRVDALPDRPAVFLATLGPRAEWTGRATWTRNVFSAAGLDVLEPPGATDPTELAAAFAATGARAACLVASDSRYANDGATAAAALGAVPVYVAGRVPDLQEQLRASGVRGFVFAGADLLALLTDVLTALEVPA